MFLDYHYDFVKKIIEEVDEMLNNLPGVTSVHGRFYDLSSKYYRIMGNHAMYYRDALRYLGCVDIKDLPGQWNWDALYMPKSVSTSLVAGLIFMNQLYVKVNYKLSHHIMFDSSFN